MRRLIVAMLGFLLLTAPAFPSSKVQVNTSDPQTLSNKTFDGTNTWLGTFGSGATFSSPLILGGAFTGGGTLGGLFTGNYTLQNPIITGQAGFADGSCGAPGITYATEPSTGFARLTPANILVCTGGVESFRINANQDVALVSGKSVFAGPNTLIGAITNKLSAQHLALPGQTVGDLLVANTSTTFTRQAIGTSNQVPGVTSAGGALEYKTVTPGVGIDVSHSANAITLAGIPRGHLSGLTMSTAGSSTTMTIAAGQATDSTNAKAINLTASLAKTTSAWAVGTAQGCLDTGAIAVGTFYHFFLILRSDTGVVDVLCSLSATAPTMPANYDYKRRIGGWPVDGSSQWYFIIQDGDLFEWGQSGPDVSANTPGTSAVLRTLSVPSGVNVIALLTVGILDTSGVGAVAYLSDPAQTDIAAAAGSAVTVESQNTTASMFSQARIRTNTSAQVRSRCSVGGATVTLTIITHGWVDRRGRDN